ncbi:MAG: hypothetical protein JRN15_12710 [Nitrososphaerota archaeon]|nr:hypothetical protein [Nitrososphaerota archaeon]
MRQPRVIFDSKKWHELVAIGKSNTSFRAFSLFQQRGRRYPCSVVDFQEIKVKNVRPGIFRFPGVNYPAGTSVRNCGTLMMQSEPLELTNHFAYWMGREQTNLVILMKNGLVDPEDYEALWVDNETDGEFVPVRLEFSALKGI